MSSLGINDLDPRHKRRLQLKDRIKLLNDDLSRTKSELDDLEEEMLTCIEGVDRITLDGITYFKQRREVATAEDWDAFYQYIKENDAIHLLQRRVGQAATLETLEDGDIPGVKKLTITKLGAKANG